MDAAWSSGTELLIQQASTLIDPAVPPLSVLSNVAALLWETLPRINWVGFYMADGDTLWLGPFQGKVACTRIPFGKGVCGTAAATGQVQLVPDVHQFSGHIACDAASCSEIVVPLMRNGTCIAVLDIDSPVYNRFTEGDRAALSQICSKLADTLIWYKKLL